MLNSLALMAVLALQGVPQQPEVAVCVVAPRVEPVQEADGAGVVPVGDPSLLVIEPLAEVRIERPGRPLWRRTAPEGGALPMPLRWTEPPIGAGETVLVRLRPRGASPDAFAHVLLVGDSAVRIGDTARLIASLRGSGPAWLAAIERALEVNDVPLAWALLFAPQAPADPELVALQQEVIRRGCGD